MKKILFVTDSYGWKATANGICVEEIANCFQNNDYEVHVLCHQRKTELVEEIKHGQFIHRIKTDVLNDLRSEYEIYESDIRKKEYLLAKFKIVNRILTLLFLHWYPLRNPFFSYEYYKKIVALNDTYCFDLIVCSYSPVEAAFGGYLFKKMYPNNKLVLYILDSFSNLTERFFLSRKWLDNHGWKLEKKLYKEYDLVLNLKCHDTHYGNIRYDIYREKMKTVDIPHMDISLLSSFSKTSKEINDRLTLIYAGMVYPYPYSKIIEIFDKLIDDIDFNFKVYTRTARNGLREVETSKTGNYLEYNGFIDRSEILEIEMNSDILISMGLPNSDFIPSKIFELILTGNKIIHFYSYLKDPCLSYYDKYDNACLIDLNDDYEFNLCKIKQFILTPKTEVCTKEIIRKYDENTPEYTYKVINEYFYKGNSI